SVPEHLDQGTELGGGPADYLSSGFLSGFGSSILAALYSWSRLRSTSAFTIASPPRSESTTSWPLITRPKTVCFPFSHSVGRWVRKNCEPFVSGPELAIESEPRKWRRYSPWTSSLTRYPGPPEPSPLGSPPWAMKPGSTRWNLSPS